MDVDFVCQWRKASLNPSQPPPSLAPSLAPSLPPSLPFPGGHALREVAGKGGLRSHRGR
jgi:hypothetical protein